MYYISLGCSGMYSGLAANKCRLNLAGFFISKLLMPKLNGDK